MITDLFFIDANNRSTALAFFREVKETARELLGCRDTRRVSRRRALFSLSEAELSGVETVVGVQATWGTDVASYACGFEYLVLLLLLRKLIRLPVVDPGRLRYETFTGERITSEFGELVLDALQLGFHGLERPVLAQFGLEDNVRQWVVRVQTLPDEKLADCLQMRFQSGVKFLVDRALSVWFLLA